MSERLVVPLKPIDFKFELVTENQYALEVKKASLGITIHTTRDGDILTVDIRMFDEDGWPTANEIVTMRIPNVR